ncbi:hypothetical protein [Algoriphagus sp.]|uniref:hypothetical protein n=1 Tax=Algoriphagus sp. TaxID=1872435 RepID=UPI00391AD709
MNRKSQFFITFLALMLMVSCQEDPEPSDPTNPPIPVGNFEVKDLQINLPQGSSFNFTGSELYSLGESFPVGADGKTKTVAISGVTSISYLFDQAGKPILAGFVTDQSSTISPKSTANVLLAYTVGLNLREPGFLKLFLDQVDALPEAKAWQEQFTELWKSDPQVLNKGNYTTQLRAVMEKLVPKPNVIDIRAKVSNISVDEGDFKSGLQIFEDGLGQFSVNNHYRRRAHAFLYKMSYKDMRDKSHQILAAIGPTVKADKDFAISPRAAATSFIGVLGTAIEGKQGDFAEVKSGPIKLDLLDVESEATYKIHIVGPGRPLPVPVTSAEISKLNRLIVETYVIDYFFPLIMEIYGYKDDLLDQKINIGEGPIERFIGATEVFLKATPEVYEIVKEGDFKGAAIKSLELLYSGAIDATFKELSEFAFDVMVAAATTSGAKIPGKAAATAQKAIKRAGSILQVVNTALLAGDFIAISENIQASRHMENWTIRARSAKVSLSPKDAIIRSRGSKAIEAKIKNLQTGGDTHPFFVWKSSGKYGYIQDTKGNKGASFESSDAKITYYSTTSAAQLPEENNWEYVYVEAFLGSQSIGKDTVKLNLRKSVYEIKPNGITLSGKQGNANSATLHIERADGSAPDFADKKVIWTTDGKYGKLKGNGGFSTTITTFGSNSINYECTDKNTQKATEKVLARIYAKSSVGGDYFLYEELEATVNINNEDDVIIQYVNITAEAWGPTVSGNYTNCGAGTMFYIDPVPNAISYTATVIEFSPELIPRVTGTTRTWLATAEPGENGKYIFAHISAGAGSGPTWLGTDGCGKFLEYAKARKGTARVIIKVKKP